jgi:hypothetical protein
MQGTFTLKDGSKVRSQSQRRFIVVSTYTSKPRIVKRSDNLQVADHFAMRLTHAVVIDTTTGKEV